MTELIWEAMGLVRRMSGVVTSDELDASAIELQADERIDSVRYIIHDFTAATEVLVSQDHIEFMAARAGVALQRNYRVKIAFVGDHPVVHALIESFHCMSSTSRRCHRFDTLQEARAFVAVRD